MANPQPEPFLKFSKELFDALLLSQMPATHKEVVLAVIRRTYGDHGQKAAPISQSLLQQITGRSRNGIRHAVDQLVAEGVLVLKTAATFRAPAVLGLNKNYEKWGRWSVDERAIVVAQGQELTQAPDGVPGEGHSDGPGEGHSDGPIEELEEQEEKKETRTAAPRPPREGDWVAKWVDAERDAGREPGSGQKATFGKKVKELANLDPDIMTDTIRRMGEQGKAPGAFPYVYGDCERAAKREMFQVQTGGRNAR